jgi:predicted TIM-barrel fold metal-dependent hydrolase
LIAEVVSLERNNKLFALGGIVAGYSILAYTLFSSQHEAFESFVYQPDPSMVTFIQEARSKKGTSTLVEKYKDVKVIDVHNHDGPRIEFVKPTWDEYSIDKVVLFGSVSEPAAIRDDQRSWNAFKKHPERFYPFFSGFDMHSEAGIEMVRKNLEQGYMGIGEVVAASTYSEVVSKVAWKGKDAMDGYLSDVYKLCAQYRVPILLHIDPLSGSQIAVLQEALKKHPDTKFILAHGNVRSIGLDRHVVMLKSLLEDHKNLYVDFFAGHSFAAGERELEAYIPLMEQYPQQFLLSTDSGYGLPSLAFAYQSMYEVIDRLTPETATKIAYENFERLMEEQPPTKTQIEKINQLLEVTGESIEGKQVNKRIAAQLIVDLEKKKRKLANPVSQ